MSQPTKIVLGTLAASGVVGLALLVPVALLP